MNRPINQWYYTGQKRLAKQLLIDLEDNFKNMEFKNMYFKDIRELSDGLHEWSDNINMKTRVVGMSIEKM